MGIALVENVHTRPLPSRDKAVPIPRERGSHPSGKGSPSLGKGVPSLGKGCPHPSVKGLPSLGKGVPSVGNANPIARKRGLRPPEKRVPFPRQSGSYPCVNVLPSLGRRFTSSGTGTPIPRKKGSYGWVCPHIFQNSSLVFAVEATGVFSNVVIYIGQKSSATKPNKARIWASFSRCIFSKTLP